MLKLHVSYGGKHLEVQTEPGWTLGVLLSELQRHWAVDPETVKLLRPKGKGPIQPNASPQQKLSEAGLVDGMKLMMVASSTADLQFVKQQQELPRMRGFEDEAVLSAARRRVSRRVAGPPSAKFTFRRYETLDLPGAQPPPAAALALLYRLASDPGIMCIMDKHQWSVGVLKEMPPEGKVGISPVCVLGLNVNKGQEIHLRLRTDDLRGFRRYKAVRDTLVHELTHMMFTGHGNDFKELNSQLLRECSRLSWSESGMEARTVAGASVYSGDDEAVWEGGGGKLRDFLEGGTSQFERWDPATAAAEAAVRRLEAGSSPPPSSTAAASPAGVGGGVGGEEGAGKDRAEQADSNRLLDKASCPRSPAAEERSSREPEGRGAAAVEGSRCGAHDEQPSRREGDEGAAPPASPLPEDVAMAAAGEEEDPNIPMDAASKAAAAMDSLDKFSAPGSTSGVREAEKRELEGSLLEQQTRMEVDVGPLGDEDPAAEYYRRLSVALQSLSQGTSNDSASAALSTLETILSNALQNPSEDRFRRIKCSNRTFRSRVGCHPSAVQVLQASGFAYAPEAGWQPLPSHSDGLSAVTGVGDVDGGMLCLTRNDPGLLWLSLAAVQEEISRLSSSAHGA
mmetsp:Transcript_39372/g.111563  ORF Transcript_39372/g.111563 Transcript_39372/m.111563 type:complete len:623 (+) Transcript_39372:253-2121(+)|eukprot:CAMPEP_0117663892 /NCGR_PEP_ID=MMETSP0804-20121206/8876_1 /TAXON_ID=1074897 /ORGANISM="Tetraselmis astigmatica, Strain CCMP880" /LENGTH=622 /DNA_ID=CAMNT_0005470983 /DNA_START=235 /DNA_END=2103 /DNA_ORIENTATION=+